jgi:hypothetical protein
VRRFSQTRQFSQCARAHPGPRPTAATVELGQLDDLRLDLAQIYFFEHVFSISGHTDNSGNFDLT